uniref:Uncharacterized protein n=1 Tax=Solanum lycopersicum TaxID=4081 RepID=A0A3Q7GXT8_SOLLC
MGRVILGNMVKEIILTFWTGSQGETNQKSANMVVDEAIDGIEPTRAKVYILTLTKRKDDRPLDEESSNIVNMMKEKLSNGETSEEQSHDNVAWEGDVYSQKSFIRNVVDDLCDEADMHIS